MIRMAGLAAFGSRWQSELCKELGVSDRTMRRWVSGENRIPDVAFTRLIEILKRRISLLNEVIETIEMSNLWDA